MGTHEMCGHDAPQLRWCRTRAVVRFAFFLFTSLAWGFLFAVLGGLLAFPMIEQTLRPDWDIVATGLLLAAAMALGFILGRVLVYQVLKWWLAACGVMVLLVMAGWVGLHLHGAWTYHRAWQAWLDVGHAATVEALLGDPAPETNAAAIYVEAFALLADLSLPDDTLASLYDADELDEDELARVIKPYKPVLAKLLDAGEREACRWPGPHAIMAHRPYLGVSRRSAWILHGRAILHSRRGQMAETERDLCGMLQMARHLRADPDVLTHLLAITLEARALHTVEMTGPPGDATWRRLQGELDHNDHRDVVPRAIQGDALQMLAALNAEREGVLSPIRSVLTNDQSNELLVYDGMPPLPGTMRRECAAVLDMYRELVGLWQAARHRQVAYNPPDIGLMGGGVLAQTLYSSIAAYNDAVAKAEARLMLARTALRLHEYRLAHGKYPTALVDLGDPLPIDPWDGQPIGYTPHDDSFTLHSRAEHEDEPITWEW